MALKVADYAYVLETGNLTMFGTGAQLPSDPQRAKHRRCCICSKPVIPYW